MFLDCVILFSVDEHLYFLSVIHTFMQKEGDAPFCNVGALQIKHLVTLEKLNQVHLEEIIMCLLVSTLNGC